MTELRTKIGKGGRLVIPARHRKALGLKPGDEVVLVQAEGELRLMSAREAVKRAQMLVRRYVGKGRKLSEELIQERREEAKRG